MKPTQLDKKKQKKIFEKIFNLGDQIGSAIVADYFTKATKTRTSGSKNTRWIIL